MKKLLPLSLLLAVPFVLVSCGSNDTDSATSTVSTEEPAKKTYTNAEMSTLYLDAAGETLSMLGIDETALTVNLCSLTTDGSPITDKTSSDYKATIGNMASCACLVELIGNLYKRDEFKVTDQVQYIPDYYYSALSANEDYYLLPSVDEENNKVYLEIYLKINGESVNSEGYYYMDVDYNFETSKVTAYHLGVVSTTSGTDPIRIRQSIPKVKYIVLAQHPEMFLLHLQRKWMI